MKYKAIFLTLALTYSPMPLPASDPAHIKVWQKQYFLDKNLGQEYLNTLATYIAYLMQTRPDEIKKNLQNEVEAAVKNAAKIKGVPPRNNFKLALIKVFKNAYSQAYKDTLNIETARKAQLAALLARRKQKSTSNKTTKAETTPIAVAPPPQKPERSLILDRCAWKQALNNYYATIYGLLDDQHKTYSYGHRRGKTLLPPKSVKMVNPIDPCNDMLPIEPEDSESPEIMSFLFK